MQLLKRIQVSRMIGNVIESRCPLFSLPLSSKIARFPCADLDCFLLGLWSRLGSEAESTKDKGCCWNCWSPCIGIWNIVKPNCGNSSEEIPSSNRSNVKIMRAVRKCLGDQVWTLSYTLWALNFKPVWTFCRVWQGTRPAACATGPTWKASWTMNRSILSMRWQVTADVIGLRLPLLLQSGQRLPLRALRDLLLLTDYFQNLRAHRLILDFNLRVSQWNLILITSGALTFDFRILNHFCWAMHLAGPSK